MTISSPQAKCEIRSGFFPDPLGRCIPPLHTLAASTRSRAREPSIISLFSPGALLFREPSILTTSCAIDDSLVCLILGCLDPAHSIRLSDTGDLLFLERLSHTRKL